VLRNFIWFDTLIELGYVFSKQAFRLVPEQRLIHAAVHAYAEGCCRE
jgi:hypothetical protein